MTNKINIIINIVCREHEITKYQMKLKTRKREIVQARQLIMDFAYIYTKLSLASIGRILGGKDHATVMHARRTVKNLCETDRKYKTEYEKMDSEIKTQLSVYDSIDYVKESKLLKSELLMFHSCI